AASPAAAPASAPAGVGAPALIDATRVVPAFEEIADSGEAGSAGAESAARPDATPADGRKAPAAVPAQALVAPGGTGTAQGGTGTASGETGTSVPSSPADPPASAPFRPAVVKTPSPVTAPAGGSGSARPQEAQAGRPT